MPVKPIEVGDLVCFSKEGAIGLVLSIELLNYVEIYWLMLGRSSKYELEVAIIFKEYYESYEKQNCSTGW